MLHYATVRGLPVHCLLTKADKISRSEQVITLRKVADALPPGATVQLFSATKKVGIDEARNTVVGWLALDAANAAGENAAE